ncbi:MULTISPECIES: hypothetical protein [Aphanothece]|uniref:hypothetical protein n=1 Tax=Aphanothece TaxID=1121 RepID=UPI00398557DF
MRLQRRRHCQVELEPPVSQQELETFLGRPIRPLRGLLDPSRLQQCGPDLFDYVSKPYGVAGLTLQPRTRLRACWDGAELLIQQVASRVEGLGEWQNHLSFGLEASLAPALQSGSAVLVAEAMVWADLPAAALVASPALHLGLDQLLDRLEGRCQKGLRRRAEGWLRRHRERSLASAPQGSAGPVG